MVGESLRMAVAGTMARGFAFNRRRIALLPMFLVLIVVLIGMGALGYRLIAGTGAFDVHQVEVSGSTKAAPSVRLRALDEIGSVSMLSVDPDRLAAVVATIPHVQSAEVDRAFPNTLRIRVVPERPVALAPSGSGFVVLAASGRVLGPVTEGTAGLPMLAAAPSDLPGAGGTIIAPGVLEELALAAAPTRALRFRAIGYGQDGLVGRTDRGAEVRIGDSRQLAIKLRVARSVLRRATGTVKYIDVTVPTAPTLRESDPNTITASAPRPAVTPLASNTNLGTWVAGSAPAESIRTLFG